MADLKSFLNISDDRIKSVTGVPVDRTKAVLGSKLNYNPETDTDVLFYSKTRSGLSLVDTKGNNATILPSAVSVDSSVTSWLFDTGIIPQQNTVFVIKSNNKAGLFGLNTDYLKFSIQRWPATKIYFAWGGSYTRTSADVPLNWFTFIAYNGKLWIRPANTDTSDSSILNIINTVTPDLTISATWQTTTDTLKLQYGIDISTSFIGTITDNAITWQQKYLFNNDAYAVDILTNEVNNKLFQVIVPEIAAQYASTYALDSGYSDISGSAINHNLANSFIEFQNAIFDRSDTNIWNDSARAATTFYNVSYPKRFHISELNRVIFNQWLTTDYLGRLFPYVSGNSYSDRKLLIGVIAYNTNKTGADYEKILKFTGDIDSGNALFLQSPYTDVFKITASGDSVFKFNFNNKIAYSQADILAKLNSVKTLYPGEPQLSKIFRFIQDTFISELYYEKNYLHCDPLIFWNSRSVSECAAAIPAYHMTKMIYPTAIIRGGSISGHVYNDVPGVGMFDILKYRILYKNKTEMFDATEQVADALIWNEQLYNYFGQANDNDGSRNTNIGIRTELQNDTGVDNLKMQLPDTSYVKFPVNSANTVNIDHVNNGVLPMTYKAFAIVTTPTGKAGLVDMPFLLVTIKGSGTVKVNGVTYTLPTDEATLNQAVLQKYAIYYHDFEILTNTGGITAEYILNKKTLLLDNINIIEKGVVSGSITVESAAADSALSKTRIVVNNRKRGGEFTFDHVKYFKGYPKIFIPTAGENSKYFGLTFYDDVEKPNRSIQTIPTTTTPKIINTTASFSNICFAPWITPRVATFTGTLEITLNSYDGASIYYTTDGTTPDATKTLYTAPFTISATTTLKAICIKANYANSLPISRVITKMA